MTMEKRFAIGMGDSVEPTPSGPDRAVTLVVHDHPAAGDMPGAA
jgi:hypothetical protein